jgi:NADH:ubiquinone oxidoreductase subunit K
MTPAKKFLLKKWVSGNMTVYPIALGIFHPLIAHGFTGDHGKLLTIPQFIMHTLSILVFIFFLSRTQNKALQLTGKRKSLEGIWPFLFFIPLVFWLGYYTLYVPFDILFMFLAIGIINAIQLKPFVKFPKKWLWQCVLTYFLASVAGILTGLGLYLLYFKNMQGIGRDFATWLMISIPAALVIAFITKLFLNDQIIMPEDYESDNDLKDQISKQGVKMTY